MRTPREANAKLCPIHTRQRVCETCVHIPKCIFYVPFEKYSLFSLHSIIHRDLKLENFLFSENEADSELKMIDFGLSKHFTFGEVHHEAVGTPYTVAPEVIKGTYDERCDVWAVGA